ncbi:MAG TPA: hypothetical protein DDW65_04345 [Firmicutes bacterium]|nr:hypothetical protein [Bacillota bacterium]
MLYDSHRAGLSGKRRRFMLYDTEWYGLPNAGSRGFRPDDTERSGMFYARIRIAVIGWMALKSGV